MKKYLIILIALIANEAHSASFDCLKAHTINEKAICSNERLSKLDEDLLKAYKLAISKSSSFDSIKAAQRNWLKEIKVCETNNTVVCLTDEYTKRIAELVNNDSSVSSITNNESQENQNTAAPQELKNQEIQANNSAISYEDVAPPVENTLSYDQSKIDYAEAKAQQIEIDKLAAEATEAGNGAENTNTTEPGLLSTLLALFVTVFLIGFPWLFSPKKTANENIIDGNTTMSQQKTDENSEAENLVKKMNSKPEESKSKKNRF